jgi:hypothetical protein
MLDRSADEEQPESHDQQQRCEKREFGAVKPVERVVHDLPKL